MGHAPIPEQNKTVGQMPLKMLQEFNHFRPTDVFLRMKPEVKINPFTLWRYADGRDCRNFAPTARGGQDRRLSSGRPRSLHRRNQGKAALFKKYERNSSSQSVFLYAANDTSSTFELPVRFSLSPFSQASDNSSLNRSATAKYIWDDRQLLNVDLLPRQSFALSTVLLNTHSSLPLAEESQPMSYAAFLSAYLVGLFLIWIPVLFALVLHTASATYALNSLNMATSWLLPTRLIPPLTTRSRAGVFSQVALRFHMVS